MTGMIQKMNKQTNDFSQGEMWLQITRMGIPLAFAQIVNVLYNLIDRMYIGHIEGIGAVALTGVGICTPIFTVITAFSNLCGMGGGPLCAIERGKGQLDRAGRIMENGFFLTVLISVLLSAGMHVFIDPFLIWLGASADSLQYARSYLSVYLWGIPFSMISVGMVFYINSQGFAKIGMLSVVIGSVINLILDPIFIFALKLGITGAAIATVISQFVSFMWCMRFLTGKKAILRLKYTSCVPDAELIKQILSLGASGFIICITGAIVQAICNKQLGKYGGDIYVALMTVIGSFRELIFNIIHGYSNGAQPVLGYNYGAGKYDRVKAGIRFICAVCLIFGAIVSCIVIIFPSQIVSLYNDTPQLMLISSKATRLYFAGFTVLTLQTACQCIFLGLGMPKMSITFAILRKLVIVVPLVYILPLCTDLGVDGVFVAELISNLLIGTICFFTMYNVVYKKKLKSTH